MPAYRILNMRLLQFLIPLLFFYNSLAQNVLPNTDVILKNKVKSLTIKNCLVNSSCFNDYYEYGSCGKVILNQPAMIATFWVTEYDKNCRVKKAFSKSRGYNHLDLWVLHEYEYNLPDSTGIEIISQYDDKGEKIEVDTNIFQLREAKTTTPDEERKEIYNSKGQLIQHKFGELHYPCGYIFKGKHTVKYEFLENGLISFAKILNEKNEVDVELSYEYEFSEK